MDVQSVNPANGELVGTTPVTTRSEVFAAVEQAREAQIAWAKLAVDDREQVLLRVREAILERSAEIMDVMKVEAGRLRPDAEAEVMDVADAVQYYIDKHRALKSEALVLNEEATPKTSVTVGFSPFGVVGLIMPWNFPFYVPMMAVIPALLAGNAVVFKPSEHSTLIGMKIGEVLSDCGVPEGLVKVIPGADETGQALVESGVDKVFFTGSVEAAVDIVAHSGTMPVQAEMGGNSAAIVFADADLDLASKGIAWAGTYHSGQDCVGIKRVFAARQIQDDLVGRLTEILTSLRAGIDYSPYISKEARDEVKRRIDAAVAQGAVLVCGGTIEVGSRGNWMTPAVLTGVTPDMEVVAKETFGNVLPIMTFDDVDDVIASANNTTYGLSNAVFTADEHLAMSIAQRLESGMVFINDPFINLPGQDHWTGWRNSGFGTMESKIQQFLRKKVVGVNHSGTTRPFWYPYPED